MKKITSLFLASTLIFGYFASPVLADPRARGRGYKPNFKTPNGRFEFGFGDIKFDPYGGVTLSNVHPSLGVNEVYCLVLTVRSKGVDYKTLFVRIDSEAYISNFNNKPMTEIYGHELQVDAGGPNKFGKMRYALPSRATFRTARGASAKYVKPKPLGAISSNHTMTTNRSSNNFSFFNGFVTTTSSASFSNYPQGKLPMYKNFGSSIKTAGAITCDKHTTYVPDQGVNIPVGGIIRGLFDAFLRGGILVPIFDGLRQAG